MKINDVPVRRTRSKILRSRMMAASGKGVTVAPVFPNAGVQAWYYSELDTLITAMYHDAVKVVLPIARETTPVITHDATPTAAGVMFECAGRVLLLARTDGLGWAFPGGGIEPGETPEQAARREVFEEIGERYNGPLEFDHVQHWNGVDFATFTASVDPFELDIVLNEEHSNHIWIKPDAALDLLGEFIHPGVKATLQGLVKLASDAAPKSLQRSLEKWGAQWIKRFDLMAEKLSLDFAAKNKQATETAMKSAFSKAGFTVPFKPTRASIEAYKVVAAEQVGLIKSIPQQFLSRVQAQVWESVKRGADLKTLSTELEKSYGVTRKRAALIARDQNAKAKATIEAVRHQELGIKQAIWMHSHAGKEPRPTHQKMNNKLYDLAKGMYDVDEGKYVHPGELINCRCTMRPYIPGFETAAYPEWEIIQ